MKKTTTILAIFLLVTAVCRGQGQTGDSDLIRVDVTKKNYPTKKLILQDFMDVEYIVLETNDEFVCQGEVLAIGKELLLIRNRIDDGDIFIFDRKGKGVRKINRKGQGSEEYTYNNQVVLDEDNGEIFVDDYYRKIQVYDLYGKFKRTIKKKEGVRYSDLRNYDRDHLIGWLDSFGEEERKPSFYIISKQDGSMADEIEIPFKEVKETTFRKYDAETKIMHTTEFSVTKYSTIIHCLDHFILAEPSSDTLYRYLPGHSLIPYMARTPSIQSMKPEVFLLPGIFTDRYFFMIIFTKREGDSFPLFSQLFSHLVYDRQENALFNYVVFNDDRTDRRSVTMREKTISDEVAFYQKFEAHELVESYEKGELKGKLKEIASKLDEEDNAVIMLVKYKK